MGESKKHKALKRKAIRHLISSGYLKNQIETEVLFPITGKRMGEPNKSYFIVDVVADNGEEKIVVECGNISKEIYVCHNGLISVIDRIATIKARNFKFFNFRYDGKITQGG